MIPNLCKGLTCRYCNGKRARVWVRATVAGAEKEKPGRGPDWSLNFNEKE